MNDVIDALNKLNIKKIIPNTFNLNLDYIKNKILEGKFDFGENRIDLIKNKRFIFRTYPVKWHMLGHLQRNKVIKYINEIDYLHSLDSVLLAKLINKYRDKPLNCFIEVNLGGSVGVIEENLKEFINQIQKYEKINVLGLMILLNDNDLDKLNKFLDLSKNFGFKYSSIEVIFKSDNLTKTDYIVVGD